MRTTLAFLLIGLSLAANTNSFAQNETDVFLAKVAPQSRAVADCYKSQSIRYAKSTCEPANTVVEAAFGSCVDQEEAYKKAAVKYGMDAATADQTIVIARRRSHPALLAVVLDARIAEGKCKRNSN